MRTCEEIEEGLMLFHLGEGDAQTERHLSSCADCLDSYWRLKRTYEQSQRGGGPMPDSILREKIRAVVLPLPMKRARWAPLAGLGAVAAALLVVLWWGQPPRVAPPAKPSPRSHFDDVDSSRPEPATWNFL